MKYLILIALLLMPVGAWGQDINQEIREVHPIYIKPKSPGYPEDRENLIRQWAASGEICRVLGHRWVDESLITVWPAPPETPHSRRRCSICGKTETRRLTEWE